MFRFECVLVTGGAGFIGSHLCEALLRRGVRLTLVDRLDDFYAPAWKQANLEDLRAIAPFEFSPADICDRAALERAFDHAQPEAVVHLAARAGVRPSVEDPLLFERINVTGTLHVLELCRQFSVRKLIFGSSSSVYGASAPVPFREDQAELHPVSPYAATKLAGERFCYAYAHLFRLPVVCLRLFTVYGPRQRPDLAIHKFVALLEAGQPLPIFGDGSSGRDYTYVDDIVAGLLAALEFDPATSSSGTPFEIFNLGNSRPVTLNELVAVLERVTGRRARREYRPAQVGDVPLTWADISKAERWLGYRPATSLEEGLRRFVAWYRSTTPHRRA
ncbi:MAG: SDR family NAD(P)-dependent oxidoreductase [Firmicutes bacterium]|nr:SDR family NAD(P)-dependent oxidoreductase [Bacillota bacterium]